MRLQVEYDRAADAAYVELRSLNAGEVVANIMVDDKRLNGYVVFDLDRDSRVTGIEVIGATLLLPSGFRDLEGSYDSIEDSLRLQIGEAQTAEYSVVVADARIGGEIVLRFSGEQLCAMDIEHASDVVGSHITFW